MFLLSTRSPPARGRSLRGNVDRNRPNRDVTLEEYAVVPYVGTWIEINRIITLRLNEHGRSLRGNVDRNLPVQVEAL